MTSTTMTSTRSPLWSLRQLIPTRACTPDEVRRIAEVQATRLVEILSRTEPGSEGIEARHIAAMPRMRVVYEALPVSGLSHWNGHEWVISLNEGDSPARQRFTLLHEFKHIIDHGVTERLYRDHRQGRRVITARQQAEQAADYFAGCALVPRRELKRAWGNRMQRLDTLADHFGVSQHAIQVRLDQTGLSREADPEPEQRRERCARPVSTPRWQRQQFQIVQPTYARREFA